MDVVVRCRKSQEPFVVGDDDREFLARVAPRFGSRQEELPLPTVHPELRAMRRMAWRNSNHLYRRTCTKTGAPVISGYPEDARYPIYANTVWWSDTWDQFRAGRAYDFSRPFFEQVRDLQLEAPRPALMNRESHNSEYCNYAGENKNCYMANNGSWYNEGCLFGESYLRCRDCLDCNYLRKSELCYDVVGGEGLYDCAFVTDAFHSSSCFFSFNIRSCTNCILCCNLRNANNCILNKPATPAELESLRAKMRTRDGIAELSRMFAEMRLGSTHPAVHHTNCEQSTGDFLTGCKNVKNGFICGTIRDGKNLFHCDEGEDLWDCSLSGYAGSQLYYETVSSGDGGVRALFVSGSWSSSDVLYCDTVMSCRSCFGCVGMKRAEHCILNRSYSKHDYDRLVPKIIGHMRETEEWGEFFPEHLAPHGYNESHAMDLFPLTRDAAEKLGYRWRDEPSTAEGGAGSFPPASIDACPDDLTAQLFRCERSHKPFRIIPAELILLRKIGIAPSSLAPDSRRRLRNERRNPPRLYKRTCCFDGSDILTSFPPERPERICCVACAEKEMYG